MKNLSAPYELTLQSDSETIIHLFISEGIDDESALVKAIEYAPIKKPFDGRVIYNLGFGDYDFETEEISDLTTKSNDDAYRIFSTVLSTISAFFEQHSQKGLLVSGSDSRPEFEAECRQSCNKKKCKVTCRKKGQRIRIYSNYVSREYEELSIDYQFFGGTGDGEDWFVFEDFKQGKSYDSVIVFKK